MQCYLQKLKCIGHDVQTFVVHFCLHGGPPLEVCVVLEPCVFLSQNFVFLGNAQKREGIVMAVLCKIIVSHVTLARAPPPFFYLMPSPVATVHWTLRSS